jgi:hypothetical protein
LEGERERERERERELLSLVKGPSLFIVPLKKFQSQQKYFLKCRKLGPSLKRQLFDPCRLDGFDASSNVTE